MCVCVCVCVSVFIYVVAREGLRGTWLVLAPCGGRVWVGVTINDYHSLTWFLHVCTLVSSVPSLFDSYCPRSLPAAHGGEWLAGTLVSCQERGLDLVRKWGHTQKPAFHTHLLALSFPGTNPITLTHTETSPVEKVSLFHACKAATIRKPFISV